MNQIHEVSLLAIINCTWMQYLQRAIPKAPEEHAEALAINLHGQIIDAIAKRRGFFATLRADQYLSQRIQALSTESYINSCRELAGQALAYHPVHVPFGQFEPIYPFRVVANHILGEYEIDPKFQGRFILDRKSVKEIALGASKDAIDQFFIENGSAEKWGFSGSDKLAGEKLSQLVQERLYGLENFYPEALNYLYPNITSTSSENGFSELYKNYTRISLESAQAAEGNMETKASIVAYEAARHILDLVEEQINFPVYKQYGL